MKVTANFVLSSLALPFFVFISGCGSQLGSTMMAGKKAQPPTDEMAQPPAAEMAQPTHNPRTFPVIAATPAITPPPQAAAAGFTNVAFDDEFNSLSMASSAYSSATDNWYPGIWWEAPGPSRSEITDSAGVLDLNWTRSSYTSAGFCDTSVEGVSANAITGKSFRYGYFEARMKWDNVTGAWPAFWLLPEQGINGNGTDPTGEIDIFEGQGLSPIFSGTLHTWLGDTDTWDASHQFAVPAGTDYTQWHTYGLLWTPPSNGKPGEMTWYFDGNALGSSPTTTSADSLFDRQNYFLIFSSQEGVDWNSCDPLHDGSPSSINLYVDWVHVFNS